MDYKQFREDNSVSGKDMISALRELYPKYGKATQSMVDNPEKYGVRLLPAAERHLAERFVGEHDGHKVPNRRKPHRLVVYLPDDLYRQVRALIDEEGCTTQEFLTEILVTWLVNIEELSR